MENITLQHFIKLMTKQPFFVWNSLKSDQSLEENDLVFDIPSFMSKIDVGFSEIQAKSFNIIDKKFNQKIKNPIILKTKNRDDKAEETLRIIKNQSGIIIDPVFKYEFQNHAVFVSPKYFDIDNKVVGFLKISSSTKLKDFLNMYFMHMVIEKNNILISDLELNILATKNYKKGEIDFYKTWYINTTKSSRQNKKLKFDFLSLQLLKSGNYSSDNGNKHEMHSILKIIKNKKIEVSINRKKEILALQNLDFYLTKIIDAKKAIKLIGPIDQDNSPWAENKEWKNILEETKNIWNGFSGNLVPKKNIIEMHGKSELANNSATLQAILNNKIQIKNREDIESIVKKLKTKVIWYDFEAFSLPICAMTGALPFQQIVSQVSLIETIKEQEINKENIVIDPQHIDLDQFVKIIDAIYKKEYHYVVFNQGYENTRLNEMLHFLKQANHKDFNQAQKKVEEIIENTIDLAEFFRASKNNLPSILIPELKGNHSIKLIEKYISQHEPNLEYKIKKYENLEVKNGLMAMEEANHRALGITGDNLWNERTKFLKEYCENDVRAMIMVYFLIKKILRENA